MILESSVFAADIAVPVDLPSANQNYMALILGSEGINEARGTDTQLRQMIDGAITAGITDRLYAFDDRLPELQTQAKNLPGNKKLLRKICLANYKK